MALETQTLKSSHITPRNKLLNSYLSLLIFSLPVPRGTKKFLGQKIATSSSHATPHITWTPGSGALHYTHLCPHWQTSQASLRHIVGPLLLQACVPASRGRRSDPSPAWIYEVQSCLLYTSDAADE